MIIQKLPEKVISQIAAGEVVERPSHMVKELVENSLDAGATRIDIDVDDGGRKVHIVDNGTGIPPEGLPGVFERHATSKIRDVEDLWRLKSFGFRGEALASLASVSRVQLVSFHKDHGTAYRMDATFGDIDEPVPASGAKGTSILVQDLFENLPARKKFLKSEAAELTQIKNTLRAMALMHPEVEWRVRSKGQLVYSWGRAQEGVRRAEDVLGLKPLFECYGEEGHFKVRIFFASPKDVMRQSKNIWIFAQKRWVVDRGLQAAVMDAYHSLLMHGEYPFCVVDLRCAEDEIDVNVHPTKSQVKFRDSSAAFRAVRNTLRRGLEMAPWIPKAGVPGDESLPAQKDRSEVASRGLENSRIHGGDITTSRPLHFKEPEFYRTQFRQKQNWQERDGLKESLSTFGGGLELVLEEPKAVYTPVDVKGYWSTLQVLGQCNLTYIVAQNDHSLILVDQHAAHERVLYERLFKAYGEKGDIESQRLLVPLSLDMSRDQADMLWSVREELNSMGVELEWAGPDLLCVHGKPVLVGEAALVESLLELADDLVEKGGSISLEKHMAHVIATMACHSSVRAGQALSYDQMKKLLVQMDEFPLSSFCPHGRPVSIEQSFKKLERDFGRTV